MLGGAVTSNRTLPQWHPPVWGIMCCLCCDDTAKLDTRHFRDLSSRHFRDLTSRHFRTSPTVIPALYLRSFPRSYMPSFSRRSHIVIPAKAGIHFCGRAEANGFPPSRESRTFLRRNDELSFAGMTNFLSRE